LYPDTGSVAGGGDAFNKDAFDCAAMGADVAPATIAPSKKYFKVFRTGMNSLRFNSPAQNDQQPF
jgi:hypothetical protein